MTDGLLVLGVDVGSVRRKGGLSWSSADQAVRGGDDPSTLAQVVASALDAGQRVAMAFECPLSMPVPGTQNEAWKALGKARTGEGNRSWSAGAGTGALATGLVQLAWVLAYLRTHCRSTPSVTTQLEKFFAGQANLLIAEALVTSHGKPEPTGGSQDHVDALAAALRLDEILDVAATGFQPDVTCQPHGAINLAVVAAMHAGLPTDRPELSQDILVAKVRPVPRI